MKVTNWRRKLAASLVAGGLMAPGAAYAQALNTNLITNPNFENVGAGTCCYSATEILDWTDGTQTGFAYNYGQGYDTGGPLAGGGSYFFSSNADNAVADVAGPGQVAQNKTLTGAVASQIASGEAALRMSAFFTSYATDNDLGNLHVEFLNASDVSLGTVQITAKSPVTGWHQVSGVSFVPVGTTKLRTSVFGTPTTFGPDGYIDLVDANVTPAQNELLYLEVNTTSGEVSIRNQTGDPFRIDYYEIKVPNGGAQDGDHNEDGAVNAADYVAWRKTDGLQPGYDDFYENFGESGGGSLDPVAWNSLEEPAGNPGGFPSGNGSGNGWEEAGGSSSTVISESFLLGNSLVANNADIDLGPAFLVGSDPNLEFYYGVVPDNGLGQFEGPGTLVRGFVRYVASGSSGSGGVPEPTSVVLVGIGLAALSVSGRSNRKSSA